MSKIIFRQISNLCQREIDSVKFPYINRFYHLVELCFEDSWQIANNVSSKSKSVSLPLFNDPEVLSSTYDQAKLFNEIFPEHSNLN